MKILNRALTHIKMRFKQLIAIFKARSISTQMIVTIVLIFASFFLLQSILNVVFFRNYYTTQEFDRIHTELMTYIEGMNEDNNDYYDEMYEFTSSNNAYSVIVDGKYQVLRSSETEYTITIQDGTTGDFYEVLLPNNDYTYNVGNQLVVMIYEYNDTLYSPAVIGMGNETLYSVEEQCEEETCLAINGTVTEVQKPNNLNYLFDENQIVQREIAKLVNSTIDLEDYEYDSGSVRGYWYRSTDGPVNSLVFVHNLKTWNWIVTVVPIVDTSDVIDIVSNYNYYVYATAIVIIFLWSFRISSIISKPIQNIELVAREIAQLNFNVEAHEYNNRENESLSRSINLISRNLKDTLETISNTNQELKELYDEQSTQVSLKKQLVSSISHELKTPLMIMQVTIQGILDGIIDPENIDEELQNILQEVHKSSVMIQDMLQIYRLDDANTPLEVNEFDLSKTVEYFIHDFDAPIKKFKLNIDANLQDEVYLAADEKLIKRVISNFFTNAIKYTPINGNIYVEVSETKDHVYFELTNYGATIAKENLEKVWMPFFRIEHKDMNPLRTKGSGIGLYLVSEILKAHDAEFDIVNIKNGVKVYFKMKKKTV